jgi:hypothetical protein
MVRTTLGVVGYDNKRKLLCADAVLITSLHPAHNPIQWVSSCPLFSVEATAAVQHHEPGAKVGCRACILTLASDSLGERACEATQLALSQDDCSHQPHLTGTNPLLDHVASHGQRRWDSREQEGSDSGALAGEQVTGAECGH